VISKDLNICFNGSESKKHTSDDKKLPTPKQGESRDDFTSRCVPMILKEGIAKNNKQAVAICSSMFDRKKKKERSCYVHGLHIKELDKGRLVSGFIATTHLDSGFEMDGVHIRDRISKETLDKWASEINTGNPRANKVSVNHDREVTVAGVGKKGSAQVVELADGEFGLYVDTIIDGTYEKYEDTIYRIDIGTLDSFSIEYITGNTEYNVGDDGTGIRTLGPETELHGWTLASRPMNENCVMIKEVMKTAKQEKETDDDKDSSRQEESKEDTVEVKQMSEETVEVKETPSLTPEEKELLSEAKKARAEKEMKERLMSLMEDKEFQEKVLDIQPKEEPMANKEEEEKEESSTESKEEDPLIKEYVSLVKNKEIDSREKFRQVGMIAEKKELLWGNGDSIEYKKSKPVQDGMGFKQFSTNGAKMEFKSLGITTNQNSDTDYLLSGAELRDMFDPVIYDALNQSTTTWALLKKDDFSQKGNNQVQFVLRTAANTTAGFYTGNAVSLGQSTLLKMQTKFKKAQAGVSVDGDMVAAARGGPVGDVFGLHVSYATEDLLTTVNTALFGEKGAETDAECLGFEYITDSANNTTLYSLTRSTTNYLSPDSAGDTYIDGSSARISIQNLRMAIKQAVVEGANRNNLVFVTHPTQEVLFKGIYDAIQRAVPTSSRFGFEGRCEFDGIPIFVDKDCNSDDWWLVDLESHRVAIWVPPTLEMLGKRSDADEGFIKMYFATYNVAPRRMVQIYSNATS